ncbi:unnamed protein product [Spirodela intermedia]|uniref:Uncharacterized protein n=1 Tax=Spirodela intermedia TaxID=51605 RepID=A0A7I8LDS3_SPIIN|nr:unnamed protein product [Spirodela intermedia]
MDVVLASSPVEAGVECWDLRTGAEQLRYRNCASAPHGLVSVAGRFIAASQLRDSSSSSGSVLYWSWDKPQVETKSFPAEPIFPLVSNSDGSYLLGGGSSGNIYIWEILSGKLLKRWQAHYMAVSCLVFSDDESLIISGSDDGSVRVWSLMRLFDKRENEVVKDPFLYSFQEHMLRVTDIVSGYGLCNSIAISSSEDRTCKVWSLSKGKMLRSITFPCIMNAIALDPGEHVFYGGGRDGKIYVAALTADCTSTGTYEKHIVSCLSEHSKAVTCLEITKDGVTLVSASEDGTVRVWDIKSQQVIRVLKHSKGPINNIVIVRQPMDMLSQTSTNGEISCSKRQRLSNLPPLDKYVDSTGTPNVRLVSTIQTSFDEPLESRYCSSRSMVKQIRELQRSSSGAVELELERLREEHRVSLQMLQRRKKLFEDLWKVHVDKLLDGDEASVGHSS